MAKKGILYGMGLGREGRVRGLMWGVVLLISLLLRPLSALAETCAEIDFNEPTIASSFYSITLLG